MRRWHQETTIMYRRWREEMKKHGYDPADPPSDGCHCTNGIGFLRKRRPYDCGNPRCGTCHCGKWDKKARGRKKREVIREELRHL